MDEKDQNLEIFNTKIYCFNNYCNGDHLQIFRIGSTIRICNNDSIIDFMATDLSDILKILHNIEYEMG